MIKYVGKCIVVEEGGGKILVVGDLHIGYEHSLHLGGIDLGRRREEEVVKELEEIFLKIGKVDKVVLLGDLKHDFSRLNDDERNILARIFDYLLKKGELIVVRGNHDNYLIGISEF